MAKAIFFSGMGTVYFLQKPSGLELYTATKPALRFLKRRGYLLVLGTPKWQEYQWLQGQLPTHNFSLLYWNGKEESLLHLIRERKISLAESYLLTDNAFLSEFLFWDWQVILLLTGKGIMTWQGLREKEIVQIEDVCKDIYSAAISIVIRALGNYD